MLRDYQIESLNEIRRKFESGQRKVLLYLATGSGKTTIFGEMIKKASEKGNHTLVLVRGRKLVDQASKRLTREKVEHGVLMSGHWNYRPHLPNQVASIDTIISRNLRPKAELIVIDEAHMAIGKSYRDVLSHYSNSYIVAVTATPWVQGGLRHVADSIVHPITMEELISTNYLVPFRYFAPQTPDLSNVKISQSTKDYVVNELEVAMNTQTLTGRIIDHWKKLAIERPTICFSVNIHHSKTLVERFKMAGISAEHCDADTTDNEREEIIKRLENGETQVVSNVGIFCTGVDIPSLSCIIMARPTRSRNLFVQQAGRGTRLSESKINCLLLDHAGNIERHGLPTDEEEVELSGRRKESVAKESRTCKQCFAVFRAPRCPECGFDPPIVIREIEESNEELIELDPVLSSLHSLKREAKKNRRKPAWIYHVLIQRYGFEVCEKYLPTWWNEKRKDDVFRASPFKPISGI